MEQQRKNSHRRTPSLLAGPLETLKAGMAKIAPFASSAEPEATADSAATIMGVIGGTGGGGPVEERNQQLHIPLFQTEEGQYLATGTEY